MIVYCRDCLFDGVPLSDIPSHGTIHEGRAICLNHLTRVVDQVIAEQIPLPMQLVGI